MQNQNTNYQWSEINWFQKLLLTVLCLTAFNFYANAQTRFTRTTFNATYTPISIGGGATSSTATGDNANQTGIPIGFSFDYADSTFTTVGLSTNGLVWFDAVAPSTSAVHTAIVTTTSPNQSLSAWCSDLIDDASSDILYQTQGSPGSRTFTIQYTNYPSFTGTPGSNVRMNCQIVLFETTNVIEFRYGSLNVIGNQSTSGGAMIGLEWGTGGNGKFIDAVFGSSICSHRMLAPLAGWPSYNFRFTPGTPTAIAAGTYNVGVGQTYNSLTQAVADVNHRGINGAVTLNLTDAQYDTTAANGSNIFPIFVATPNADTTNRLTISKTGVAATLAYRGCNIASSGAGWGTGVATTAISHGSEPMLCVLSSYNTISNINLVTHGNSPQTVEIGLAQCELFGNKGAQHNLYDKISVDLDRTKGDAIGIYSFNVTAPGGSAGANSYNTWRDINIKDCNLGLYLHGVNTATGPADFGNRIITSSCSTYNYIGDPNTPDDILGDNGVLIGGQYDVKVSNCIIQNITISSIYSINGIGVTNSYGPIEISNNIIRNIRRSNTALNTLHWVSGIRCEWPNQAINFKIYNNSISNLLSSYTGASTSHAVVVGLFMRSNTGNVTTEIYNNSISIDGSTFPSASSLCLVYNAFSESCQIKNNVIANFTSAQTGVAHHVCVYTNAADRYGNTGSLFDYNNYYIADTVNGHIAKATTTYLKTLADWQAAMTFNPGTDANSQVANPNFVNNATDLHPTSASTSLDGTGTTPPLYVITDLDCKTRTSPHDIGAYWAGCWAEAGVVSPNAATICGQQTYVMAASGYDLHPTLSYQWQRATVSGGPYSNVSGGSGANTSTYTTDNLPAGTFYYVLKVECPDGLIDYSNELTLTVNQLPDASITAGGPTTFCGGDSVLLSGVVAANRAYQWKRYGDDVVGANSVNYTAKKTGNFKLQVTNTLTGCSKTTTNSINVVKNPVPPASITPLGPISFCAGDSVVLQANSGAGLTYSWKKFANFIPGETQQTYTAKVGGTYKVQVTNTYGCKRTSDGVVVSITCKEVELAIANSIAVYPNPVIDKLTIVNISSEIFVIEITNSIGELVLKTKNQNVIDVSKFESGVYLVKVISENRTDVSRFVKE